MKNYPFVKLGEIVDKVIDYRGVTPTKRGGKWASGGIRALSALNVKTRCLVALDKVRYVNEELYKSWMREEIQKGDIIITSEAPFGEVYFWNTDEKIVLSQRLYGVRLKQNINASFVFQYMTSSAFQGELHSRATGSTVEGLRQPALLKCLIAIPNIEIQEKIASILSAYDNLIEVNNKRIKVLEQMAENLYKEWFVRFRFPGYETADFENGLPKGWEEKRLGDFGISLDSGSRPLGGVDASLETGMPSFGAEAVNGLCEFDYTNVKLVPDEFYAKMKCGKNTGKDILVYKDGAYIGKVTIFMDCFPYENYAVNEHVFLLNANNSNYQYYLYFTLHLPEYFMLMQNLNRNAAQPGLSKLDMEKIKIVVPSIDIVTKYNQFVEPILHEAFKLAKNNYNLIKQRDLLLPRLMSGKLEV